jgi:hypothetical protein
MIGQPVTAPEFPAPYLQPDRMKDCGYYTAAYIARCLGQPDVTAGQIKAWRAETRYHEDHYCHRVLGAEIRTYADEPDEERSKTWWLGPGTEEWVRSYVDDGWIGHATVWRIPDIGHSVALLGAADAGVLLMDPIYGHIIEPWGWFLGIGSGKHGCHRIDAWYRKVA